MGLFGCGSKKPDQNLATYQSWAKPNFGSSFGVWFVAKIRWGQAKFWQLICWPWFWPKNCHRFVLAMAKILWAWPKFSLQPNTSQNNLARPIFGMAPLGLHPNTPYIILWIKYFSTKMSLNEKGINYKVSGITPSWKTMMTQIHTPNFQGLGSCSWWTSSKKSTYHWWTNKTWWTQEDLHWSGREVHC